MNDAPTELPVLCFFAGSVALGVAARGVDVLAETQREHPHLADLLGLPTDDSSDSGRTIQLSHAQDSVRLRVDGPVRIENIGASQILSSPTSMRGAGRLPVIGYAKCYRQLMALLDISRLVELAKLAKDDFA